MEYLKSFKLFESITKPEPKYPVDKCLDYTMVEQELLRLHNISTTDMPMKGVSAKYGTVNFDGWVGENLEPIFPKPTQCDISHEWQKEKFGSVGMPVTRYNYFESEAVYELPENYDSAKDLDNWYLKKAKFKSNMEQITGKPWDDKNDQHVNFGPKTFDWVNIILHKIHELYPEYYKNGKIRIWNDRDEYDREKQIFDYPLDKSYFLSELEEWIKDTFDIDTTGFLEWILKCQFIEGRYWMRVWTYNLEDKNFRKQTAPENIQKINEVLKQIYKVDEMKIFIDYYKKFTKKEEKEIYD